MARGELRRQRGVLRARARHRVEARGERPDLGGLRRRVGRDEAQQRRAGGHVVVRTHDALDKAREGQRDLARRQRIGDDAPVEAVRRRQTTERRARERQANRLGRRVAHLDAAPFGRVGVVIVVVMVVHGMLFMRVASDIQTSKRPNPQTLLLMPFRDKRRQPRGAD